MNDDEKEALENGNGTPAEGDAGAGNAAEAELKAAEEALASEADDDGEGEDGGKNADGAGKQSRLQKRIKRLVEARKSYERFGAPIDLERKLAKLEEYEKLEKQLRAEQAAEERKRRETSGEADIARKFSGYFDKTFGDGAARDFQEWRQNRDSQEQREVRAYAKQGRDHIVSILKENGIPIEDPAVVQAYEHTMATFIGENQELLAKYADPNTQRDALADSFKFAASRLLNPILAAAGAGTYEQIAARKSRALGSGRGTSAGSAVDLADEKPPKNATPDQIHEWHKRRASKAWDAVLDADEASALG